MQSESTKREAIVLRPGEGRRYEMGRLHAVFKADGEESRRGYSIAEWWLEPHTGGPGAHAHPEDDVFFVLEGTVSFLLGETWLEVPKGSFILVPGGQRHDFQNRGDQRAGLLNLSFPGGFEDSMPAIVEWFQKHPPEDLR